VAQNAELRSVGILGGGRWPKMRKYAGNNVYKSYFWDPLKDVSTWTVPQWIITVDDVSDFLANKPVWIYPSPTIR
jgi:hypothetical protein